MDAKCLQLCYESYSSSGDVKGSTVCTYVRLGTIVTNQDDLHIYSLYESLLLPIYGLK